MAGSNSEALVVTLEFNDGTPTKRFELQPGGKEAISCGRAPKSDIVCNLSGISWKHMELRLVPPTVSDGLVVEGAASLSSLVVRDLSMNGTGIQLPGETAAKRLTKDIDEIVPEGASISYPTKKPKPKKGEEETKEIKQSFTVHFGQPETDSGSEEDPLQAAVDKTQEASKKRPLGESSQDGKPAKLLKGEDLVKSAREAEAKGRLVEAFDAYRRGLQHIFKALPLLSEDSPLVQSAKAMVKSGLDRAAAIKSRAKLPMNIEAP
eukprot:TRINITY_DN14401_c1_g3_i2.p1 TRINITY_DN14401_c1_g3~~TRINITY_DN14401_c1_g3_i2.p1  ORF type:complete len:264 (-),score=70.14 TRINITY_DN14401_c1_g3_i2:106-897(-)